MVCKCEAFSQIIHRWPTCSSASLLPLVATMFELDPREQCCALWEAVVWRISVKFQLNAAASNSDVLLIIQWFLGTYIANIFFSKPGPFPRHCSLVAFVYRGSLKRLLSPAAVICAPLLFRCRPRCEWAGEHNERLVPPSVLRQNKKWHFLFVLPVCLIPGNADNQQGRGVKCIINLPRGSHLALGAHPDAAAATLGYVRSKVL